MNALMLGAINRVLDFCERGIKNCREMVVDEDGSVVDGPLRVVNLTGHNVVLYNEDGKKVVWKAGRYAGVHNKSEEIDDVRVERAGQIGIMKSYTGQVRGLPEPRDGVLYVVSRAVKNLVPDREDCVVPYRVMKYHGRPYGCRMFAY